MDLNTLTAAHHRWELGTYALLGVALWPVPLLGLLHVEASAVVAAASFFVAGLAALRDLRREESSFARVLGVQEALLAVPLLLLTATLPWRPNCDYLRGLLLYAAMPPVTVAFAVALAHALAGWGVRYAKTVLVLAGLGIGIGGPLYDLGLHPQFYTYNHLFGGVLGPLYDRELALRPGFFAFRALTLLWAVLFWLVGRWGKIRRSKVEGRQAGLGKKPILALLLATALAIGAAYANAARLGFNTPAWRIQEVLGGHRRTAHFDLYYDPSALSEEEVTRLAEDHEWHYHRLAERLGTAPEERIASYLYPNEDVKACLTGARRTSVAPVWLGRPQVHLLQDAYERSFGHELVHAFSREFGLPLLKASRSVGLVEGLAVAFELPDGRPSPADQVSAAALAGRDPAEELDLAEGVAARLSPLGFWTGRGAVSYTTMGAFVRFLAERYGPEKLRAVYAWANFEEVYGKPVRALAEEWETALLARRQVAHAAGALAVARFSQPSLFEVACPHYVPPHVRVYRRGRAALTAGDTTRAREYFRKALGRQPAFETARVSLARLLLASPGATGSDASSSRRALRLLRAAPDSAHGAAYFVARADAQVLRRTPATARRSYERALEQLLPYRHETRAQIHLRRALASQPSLVHVLAGTGTPLVRAHRLRAAGNGSLPPAAAVLRAVLLSEGRRFARAAQLLEATPPVTGLPNEQVDQTVRLQRRAWRAVWWHRAGRAARAEGIARRLAATFRTQGDRDAVARWKAFAAKMRWAQKQ